MLDLVVLQAAYRLTRRLASLWMGYQAVTSYQDTQPSADQPHTLWAGWWPPCDEAHQQPHLLVTELHPSNNPSQCCE